MKLLFFLSTLFTFSPITGNEVGVIEYTDEDNYPALCIGKRVDAYGQKVVASIAVVDGILKITATSCTHIFSNGFE